jgi:hypothetical protein
MDSSLKFKVVLTRQDLVSAIQKFYLSQLNTWAVLGLLVLAVLLMLLGMVPSNWQPGALVLILLAAGSLGYSYFINPGIAAGRIEQQAEDFGRETLWSIHPDGLTLLTGSSHVKLKWDKFRGFLETRDAFLLLRSDDKRVFQIVPKRALDSTGQLADFSELLRSRFPGHDRPSWLPRRRSILIVIAIVLLTFLLSYALGRLGQ